MTIHNRPTEPASGHRRPLRLIVPIPPRASPRACLEAQIDLLLEMLDRIDGDPDLEDNGDLELTGDEEPSLGSLDRRADQRAWNGGTAEDYEVDETKLGLQQIPDHSPAIQHNRGLSSLVSEVSP